MINGIMQAPTASNAPTDDFLVGDLIDHDIMHWRLDLLHHIFDQASFEAIMAITIVLLGL